jgi:diaminopropionate ammonia-lyase
MLIHNNHPDYLQPLEPQDARLLDAPAAARAERFFVSHPGYQPTPLRELGEMARASGVDAIFVKDESARLGLDSFKALGGMYAAARLVLDEAGRILGRTFDTTDLHTAPVRETAAGMVLVCATDGNHGRAVAAGARLVGAAARVYVHQGVSAGRRAAIADLGAVVVVVEGNYDDAVAEAARAGAEHGWHCLSDTSWLGYERIPGYVMQGYTLLMKEALDQLPRIPTHLFIQAGVGGLAAAAAGYLALRYGAARPRLIVVEPSRAACLLESMRAGHAVRIVQGEPTMMAMLECQTPSLLAWRILTRAADAFMTVGEDDALAVMRVLAQPCGSDPALVAGESGGVGLAGLLRVADDAGWRAQIGLGSDSRVLVINTEGATDPARFEALVGRAPLRDGSPFHHHHLHSPHPHIS